ncbi:ligand-binding sensor domain-containing diguanylate cyclase [Arenimonas oryziterrae]|uniref:diguanylate cyclase n=1 Tax=Arenimonas oryziterrae DSM 21050 = YC6267 TaxID=1121015 RepID=A0A091AWI3_9GAMM|nr:ligand-binding sensor domain-containing diguanylate cyclase [Arenimonas oryziterrae]KFN43796.1 hypothetical protein N789_07575 [Arenimonas oryziterrae DSM 21050 = YC6267]
MRSLPGRFLVALSLVLSLALCPLPDARADGPSGMPLLRRYLPEDYNATPQQLAIATDREGRLYVGNGEGVLRYDGDAWTLITLPGKTIARDLAIGRDNHVYVASYDSFGWLQTSDDGQMRYEELLTAGGLSGRDRDVGIVWDVHATSEGVYFRAEKNLHFLSYDRRRVRHWPLAENVRSFYVQDDALYARVAGLGFCRFEDGRFTLEPGGALFADKPLPGMIPKPGWRLLVGDDGLYRADARGIARLPNNAGSELAGTRAYEVLPLADDSFVVGTLEGEVFRYAKDYHLAERVNLGSYGIQALGADSEGGLWAATEGDLVRMALPSPWSFLGSDQGLRGTVTDFEWFDGALWVATTRGFIRLTADAAGRTQADIPHHIDYEAYTLVGTDSGLLMGFRNGLMVRDKDDGKTRILFTGAQEGVFEIRLSSKVAGRAYGLSEENLLVLQNVDGHWKLAQSTPLDGASAATLVETAADQIWFGDSRGGPQRWTLDAAGKRLRAEVFGANDGLAIDANSGSSLYLLEGQVHVITGERGYRFDGKRFVADTGPPFTLVDRPNELDVVETPVGTYAYSSRQLWLRPVGASEWKAVNLGSQRAAGFTRVRFNRDGKLRVATWSGLLQFDASQKEPTQAPLRLGFESVSAERPDGQEPLRLPIVSEEQPVEIPAGYRLHFRYSLVSMEGGLQFRYLLHGLTEQWSDWTDRDLYVRALTPGDYVLEVEARTRGGRTAGPVSYRYRVLPEWYMRWWVLTIFGLVVLVAAAFVVQEFIRRRTQRYREANRKLEARIAERTSELEEVNRKLAELATEDALTGVNNRRALEQGLQREWFRCLDQRRPLAVLMIDVDHFKRYNDAHGHLEGDVLLRRIAQRLIALHDPKRELMARYGGEEFALLLPGVHLDEALRRAEAIRAAMHAEVTETTVSIGVAGFVPSVQGEPNSLLRRADAALYRAKRAGRNRVEADADPPPPR